MSPEGVLISAPPPRVLEIERLGGRKITTHFLAAADGEVHLSSGENWRKPVCAEMHRLHIVAMWRPAESIGPATRQRNRPRGSQGGVISKLDFVSCSKRAQREAYSAEWARNLKPVFKRAMQSSCAKVGRGKKC